MFFFGFLLAGAIFVAGLLFISRFLPGGKTRLIFMITVFGFVIGYPYLHLIRPSYAKFNELCAQPAEPTIVQTQKVDFILIEYGYASDCTTGPAFIKNRGYLGFDCVKLVGPGTNEPVTEFRRYTRKPGVRGECDTLDCFDMKLSAPETKFGQFAKSNRTRAGYLEGNTRRVTMDWPQEDHDQPIPFWQWLRFSDSILVDATRGEMAFMTHYYYLPYGPLTVLGAASGSAPTEACPRRPSIDPRLVYVPNGTSAGRK